ncbi:MAG TPA: hypothetical protein VHZ07_20020 [Bryobacteraceae bacterium]|jgi:hypothetical protein|nr:hypothetical protein [Bryobacteraceae bacterium]
MRNLAVLTTLVFTAVLLNGQSGRSYSVGADWWEAGRGAVFPLEEEYDNPSGEVSILNIKGMVSPEGHPFFEALGANGRACITCHQPGGAMSVSVDMIRKRWVDSGGKDAIFAAIDGSNCPDLPQDVPQSHSLLLNRGLFRMVLPWPPRASDGSVIHPEFRIEVVRDPTGCNTNKVYGLLSPHPSISVFRRPRIVANFKYVLSRGSDFELMSDGREPSLRSQAITAALTHEQAKAAPAKEQLDRIVDFEMQIFAAQSSHIRGGLLDENNVLLGPENLAYRKASLLSGGPASAAPSFDLWRSPKTSDLVNDFRASIARGSNLFFRRRFKVPEAVLHTGPSVRSSSATCATCHQGGISRSMDIGTTDRPDLDQANDLPLFRITCDSSVPPHPLLGRVIYTEDPGRALATGKCADVGSIVMQQLRGLAARAPYFANGSAKTLADVVDFYDRRFSIGYSQQEKQDLIDFLSVL